MCSNGKCDMVVGLGEIINGPVGNLVGMGIKALVNGAPIGPRSAELSRKSYDKEMQPGNGTTKKCSLEVQQFYDNVEGHLNGVLQIIEPALKIKRILMEECKSAEHARPAPESKLHPIQYYSPQYSHQKYPTSSCSSQCCGLRHQSKKSSTINKLCCSTTKKSDFSTTKKSESSTTKQLGTSSTTKKLGSSTKASYHHTTDKSADITPQYKGFSSSVKCSSTRKKIDSDSTIKSSSRSGAPSTYKTCSSTVETSYKCYNPSTSNLSKSKQVSRICVMCNGTLQERILLSVLPCEHTYCYTCLAKDDGSSRCQKCHKSFDIKNVTQLVRSSHK